MSKFFLNYKKLIPGGCHTYSKADNQFTSNAPPAIIKGSGCYVYGTDNKKYLDCGMGLSSVSIGHANKYINNQVKKELDKGLNFNRPSILEFQVAKEFLNLVPNHQMIKFAKNGSTVTTAAIKLARAYTNRDLVAFPKEHFFYSYDDWFMSKQKCNAGIPSSISNKTITFNQCNINSLKEIFKKYKNRIACVILEPEKNYCNTFCKCKIKVSNYLKQAEKIIKKNGALFITDEMVTGFKTFLPGSTVKYNLKPDLTTWGKGLANGYSFCALTGTKNVMELGGLEQKHSPRVFLISSTHGAETGPLRAFLATLKIFKTKKVIQKNKKILRELSKNCQSLIIKHNFENKIKIVNSDWLLSFVFLNRNKPSDKLRTLFMQEMIKNRILFQGFFIPSYSHNKKELNIFIKAFEKSLIFSKKINKINIDKLIKGKIVKPIFTKFN